MKLEFLESVNADGDNVVRLFDYDDSELTSLISLIQDHLIVGSGSLILESLDFVSTDNCNLELVLSDGNIGIELIEDSNFRCCLTKEEYKQMVLLIESLIGEDRGYQWLYDLDSQTEFLLSKSGQW